MEHRDLYEDQQRRFDAEARDRENRSRLATVFGHFRSVGIGSWQFEDPVEFGVEYIEKPAMSYGIDLDVEDLAELLDTDEDEVPLPISAGMVVEWETDDNGFYIGAYVAARVTFPAEYPDFVVPLDLQPEIDHHFTFVGTALKYAPIDDNDD